jgi:histidine triad (HIT) family protein
MSDCIFCKIVAGEIPVYEIYRDEKFVVFPDRNPLNTGHVLIVPKEHVDFVFDVSEATYNELFQLVRRIAPVVREAMDSARIGLIVEGFGMPHHSHIHVIPINTQNELDPSRSRPASEEELKETAEKIRSALKNSV